MEDKNLSKEALCGYYKNTHMALQSISNIMGTIADTELKKELQSQYEQYEKVTGEISSLMTEMNVERKEPNAFEKAMLWSSIKLNTLTDNSNAKIAAMIIKGTVNGIIDLHGILNQNQALLNEKVYALGSELLHMQEENIEKVKPFL